MDLGNYSGLQDPVSETASEQTAPGLCFLKSGREGNLYRDREAVEKTGHQSGCCRRRICEQHIFGPQKRQAMETDSQPQGTQCLHRVRALQDGGYSLSEGPPVQRGLYVQVRPQRCLSLCTNQLVSPKVFDVSVAREEVSIQCPPIRFNNSTSCVHEASETCAGPLTSKRSEIGCLPGRHFGHRQESERSRGGLPTDPKPPGESRLCGEQGEVTACSFSDYRLPGIHSQFQVDELQASNRESKRDKEVVQKGTTDCQCVR